MRNKATKKNMDLDLRRYGKMLYSKAENSEEGGSGEVDYEAIYQFYRKIVLESVPEEYLQSAVIPEHLDDVEWGSGTNHANETRGIWKSTDVSGDYNTTLFCVVDERVRINSVIYVGPYSRVLL